MTCMTCRGNGQNNLRLTAQALNKNRLGIENAEHVTPKSRHQKSRIPLLSIKRRATSAQ